jgi:hypothetical protein
VIAFCLPAKRLESAPLTIADERRVLDQVNPLCFGKPLRSLPREHAHLSVSGIHQPARDANRIGQALHAHHGSERAGFSVHHTGVQLHLSVLVEHRSASRIEGPVGFQDRNGVRYDIENRSAGR